MVFARCDADCCGLVLTADCDDVEDDEEEPPHPARAKVAAPSSARAGSLIMLLMMSDRRVALLRPHVPPAPTVCSEPGPDFRVLRVKILLLEIALAGGACTPGLESAP